jgi:hypothetical protein
MWGPPLEISACRVWRGLLGAISIGANRAGPLSGDDAGSLLRVVVVHGASPSIHRHTTLGDAVSAPGFPGAEGPG